MYPTRLNVRPVKTLNTLLNMLSILGDRNSAMRRRVKVFDGRTRNLIRNVISRSVSQLHIPSLGCLC